ncbi:hypothetical protein J1C56_08170 [Aminobacter anthyllidis]|uniref:Uncharacterized protein n=1 Tax=Aminobacter anthyllidis TaxID=1035067 RepID=A0A9X1D5E3_9HYPH|nr:hypothetical protein [Aminobacter anthyllidis]MBT1155568.1 hypothetical protein [Aminobacter anthyllidis]
MPVAHERRNRLMLAIIAIGVVHIGEQLMFGIDEFHKLRAAFDGWYALFPDERVDEAHMLLITLIGTIVSLGFYAMMRGGTPALVVISAFGGIGLKEVYHWIEAIQAGAYTSGLATSFAYVWAGWQIKQEVSHELKLRRKQRKLAAKAVAA